MPKSESSRLVPLDRSFFVLIKLFKFCSIDTHGAKLLNCGGEDFFDSLKTLTTLAWVKQQIDETS